MTEEPELNYIGEWTRGGYKSPKSDFEIPRMEMWDFLTLWQYMCKLSNIQVPSGRSVTAKDEKLGKVLELGADWGHAWPALESCFEEVYGIEIEEWAVKLGIERGRNIVCGDIAKMFPYADNTFDAVVSAHVLEHSADPKTTLTEVLRVTKPGGWSVHTLPCTHDGIPEIAGDFHKACFSYLGWRQMFVDAGFEIVTDYFGWASNIEEWIVVGRKNDKH